MPSPQDRAESQPPFIPVMDRPTSAVVRLAIEAEHLRLLAIFHYVLGGFTLLSSCIFLIHVFMGLVMITAPEIASSSAKEAGAHFVGYIFTGLGTLLLLAGWLYGALTLYAGRCLQLKKHRTFIMVMSAINCFQMPWGTLLGCFTIKVLLSPTIVESFNTHGPRSRAIVSAASTSAAFPALGSAPAQPDVEEEAIWLELEKSADPRSSRPDPAAPSN